MVLPLNPPDPEPSPRQLPEFVAIRPITRVRPNELRAVQLLTGRTFEDLSSNVADTMQLSVFLTLRREGYDLTWDDAGEIEADLSDVQATADPTIGEPFGTSPGSVGSGA